MPQHHNANKGNRQTLTADPHKLQETIQVLGSRLQNIWELVQVNPNDQDLGREIRRYINLLSEEAKTK